MMFVKVTAIFHTYHLRIEKRLYYGMRFGGEEFITTWKRRAPILK